MSKIPVKWAYGVTTVLSRLEDGLLQRTLNSLAAAGFDQPRLFVDGSAYSSEMEKFGLETTYRYPQIRTFGNWCLSLGELYIRSPNADYYAIFQDDFVTYRNLRTYLERCHYPEKGYWNLYTFPVNQEIADRGGHSNWFLSNQRGKGAVALVFSRRAVHTVLSAMHMIERPMDALRGHKSVDGGIVTAMEKAGWQEWCHNPSLVQHTGLVSSMRNRQHPLATSFKGEQFDANNL